MFFDESSDSENEVLGEVQSPVESPSEQSETTKALEAKKKNKVIQRPTVDLNDTVTIQPNSTLILATDIVSSVYLQHLIEQTKANTTAPAATIKTLINKKKNKIAPTAPNFPKTTTTTTTPAKPDEDEKLNKIEHLYTLYNGTDNVIFGTLNFDIPNNVTNFIAEAIFDTIKPAKVLFYTALPLAKVKTLLNDDDIQYPLTYCLNNLGHFDDVAKSPEIFNTKDSPISPFPSHLSLQGFAAALVTYATLYNVPIIGTISILNIDYISDLWLSFNKHSKLYNLSIPSIYIGHEKPTKALQNTILKTFKTNYAKQLAEQDKLLPHGKQSGSRPDSMFF